MLDRQHAHRGLERSVWEQECLSNGLDRSPTGASLLEHRPRWLDRDDDAVLRLVGAGASPHVDDVSASPKASSIASAIRGSGILVAEYVWPIASYRARMGSPSLESEDERDGVGARPGLERWTVREEAVPLAAS